MAKRLLDLLLGAVLLAATAPALLAAAVAIKLDSPGPVLFRQERVGRLGRPFRIHKLRTMAADAARRGPQLTVRGDPRVTRLGAFLRRHKLDELPQLVDVVLGRMSLVGPRPEVPGYVARYPADLRELVLSVRPGITDLASIEFRDEERLLAASADPERTYLEEVLPAKLRYAADYVRTRSLLGDLRLMARTVAAVWGPR